MTSYLWEASSSPFQKVSLVLEDHCLSGSLCH